MSEQNGRREGFNADERAGRRERGVVTIGGISYHPARLTNARLRDVRRISRDTQRRVRETEASTEEYKQAYEDAIDRGEDEAAATRIARSEAQFSEEVDTLQANAIAQQLRILLVGDDMQPPAEEQMLKHVDEDIDNRDQLALLSYLTGDDPGESQPPELTSTPSAAT